MTAWDFLAHSLEWLSNTATRILGVATGTLVTLTGTGIIPDKNLKYWMAAVAVLTFWRGQSTGATYKQARAVLAANPTSSQPAEPAQPTGVPKP